MKDKEADLQQMTDDYVKKIEGVGTRRRRSPQFDGGERERESVCVCVCVRVRCWAR